MNVKGQEICNKGVGLFEFLSLKNHTVYIYIYEVMNRGRSSELYPMTSRGITKTYFPIMQE